MIHGQRTAQSKPELCIYPYFLTRLRSGPPSSAGSAINELSSCDTDDDCDSEKDEAWADGEGGTSR